MSLGATLNNAGHLVRDLDRREYVARKEAVAGDRLWFHGLKANGSIVSELCEVQPGGTVKPVEEP